MKVSLTAEMMKFITVAEMPAVKKVMQYEKEEDFYSAKDWAEIAAKMLFGHSGVKVLEASAEIAKNRCIRNVFDEETRDIDVWIRFTAFNGTEFFGGNEFVIAGVYLSDLWKFTSDNADEIKQHMYIRRFKEVD